MDFLQQWIKGQDTEPSVITVGGGGVNISRESPPTSVNISYIEIIGFYVLGKYNASTDRFSL